MNNNQIENILCLDENNEKRRQKQLYGHDLEFDPNRPIYQHPLNLANYTDGDNQEVFNQMVRNLIHTIPLQQQLSQLKKYDEAQRQIQNLEQGYINELEQQEVQKTIQQLKDLIEEKNRQIRSISQNNQMQAQQNIITREQIDKFTEFVKDNETFLNNLTSNQQKFEKQQNTFNQLRDNLNSKREQLQKEFDRQYKTLLFQKDRLAKLQQESKNKQIEVYELQNQLSAIHSLGLSLEDEVDSIKSKVDKQRTLAQEEELKDRQSKGNKGSKISQVEEVVSQMDMSPASSRIRQGAENRVRTANSVRYVTHIKKQGSNWWFLVLLIVATVALGLATVNKLL